jgi:hypothetical protein
MALFSKNKKINDKSPTPVKEKVIRRFVFVEVPLEVVAPIVFSWGEAAWWPTKGCSIKFTRKTPGDLGEGTRFRLKILKPLAPSWDVEVSKFVPQKELQLNFLNGPLRGGYEIIRLEWRYNGTRIDYERHYNVRGLLNKIIWPILGQKIYDKSIKVIFDALKDNIVEHYKTHDNKNVEGP